MASPVTMDEIGPQATELARHVLERVILNWRRALVDCKRGDVLAYVCRLLQGPLMHVEQTGSRSADLFVALAFHAAAVRELATSTKIEPQEDGLLLPETTDDAPCMAAITTLRVLVDICVYGSLAELNCANSSLQLVPAVAAGRFPSSAVGHGDARPVPEVALELIAFARAAIRALGEVEAVLDEESAFERRRGAAERMWSELTVIVADCVADPLDEAEAGPCTPLRERLEPVTHAYQQCIEAFGTGRSLVETSTGWHGHGVEERGREASIYLEASKDFMLSLQAAASRLSNPAAMTEVDRRVRAVSLQHVHR